MLIIMSKGKLQNSRVGSLYLLNPDVVVFQVVDLLNKPVHKLMHVMEQTAEPYRARFYWLFEFVNSVLSDLGAMSTKVTKSCQYQTGYLT